MPKNSKNAHYVCGNLATSQTFRNTFYSILLLSSYCGGRQLYDAAEGAHPASRVLARSTLVLYSLLVIIGAIGLGRSAVGSLRNSKFFSSSSQKFEEPDKDKDSDTKNYTYRKTN
jgi:hypothetical protein